MKINVIGKQHLSGTSKKTGKPYDFIQLHYNGNERGVEGVAAKTVSIDTDFYPYDRIVVGQDYVLEFDGRGYVVEFAPVSTK